MKLIKNFMAIALSAIAMTSCLVNTRGLSNRILTGSDEKTDLNDVVESFDKIKIKGSIDVTYVPSDVYEYKAVVPENFVERFQVEVNDKGVLVLSLDKKDNIIISNGEIKVTIYGPQLYGVDISGSGDFNAEMISLVGEFNLNINGSGDVEINELVCDRAEFFINGSGDIDVKKINTYDIVAEINGSGDIDIAGKTEGGKLVINGAGDIDVENLEVSEHLETKVRGSGSIHRK